MQATPADGRHPGRGGPAGRRTRRSGSHHLLLAALADPDSAAARTLAGLGVDLDQAKELLRSADVTGTSDEPPEEAGRRQMSIQVTGETLTIVVVDPVLVAAGEAALKAVNEQAGTAGEGGTAEEGAGSSATTTVIRGDHPAAASLAGVWLELRKSLAKIAAGGVTVILGRRLARVGRTLGKCPADVLGRGRPIDGTLGACRSKRQGRLSGPDGTRTSTTSGTDGSCAVTGTGATPAGSSCKPR